MRITKQDTCQNTFPYIAYIPEKISDHPALLIQLHGAGERGNGCEDLDKVLIHGFSKIVNDNNLRDCILILPQCPTDTFWAARTESIKRFVDEMIIKYSADTGRIYLCGLSMGGFGTWFAAMAYPDLFAAIAPCCGGGMAWNAAVLKMPVWAFHGLEDSVVSPRHTMEMVEALKPINPLLKFDFYEGVGHDSWNKAFSEETLRWILSQKKAMKHDSLLNCEIEVDEGKTKQWYAQAEAWGCDCEFCVNFLDVARQGKLPEKVLNPLSFFGIPPEKATYVCCLNTDREKPLYQFSYRIAGNILKSIPSATAEAAHFCHETYPYGAPDFPEPHFDLEFFAELPWVTKKAAE